MHVREYILSKANHAAEKIARNYRGRLMRKLFLEKRVITTNMYLDVDNVTMRYLKSTNVKVYLVG